MKLPNIRLLRDRRPALGVVCMILSAVLAFGILPQIYQNKNQTTTILKLTSDIPAGTQIQETMLHEKELRHCCIKTER